MEDQDGQRQSEALTEASAAKAREASGPERDGHVFGEKYRDGRNMGREPAGEGCTTDWEGKIARGWREKKKQLEIRHPIFSHSSLVSAWTTAYAGDGRRERAEHRLKGDGRGWQHHETSRGELDLALSSPFPSSKSGDSTGVTQTAPFSGAFRSPAKHVLLHTGQMRFKP